MLGNECLLVAVRADRRANVAWEPADLGSTANFSGPALRFIREVIDRVTRLSATRPIV